VTDTGPHVLEVTVRLDGKNGTITTTLDSAPLYEWAGPVADLSQAKGWKGSPPGSIAVGASSEGWEVSEVKVKRIEEKEK